MFRSGGCSCRGTELQKSVLPAEQLRPADRSATRQWTKYQGRLDPAHLVFIDETCAKTNMVPLRGWAPLASGSMPKCPMAIGAQGPSWRRTAATGSMPLACSISRSAGRASRLCRTKPRDNALVWRRRHHGQSEAIITGRYLQGDPRRRSQTSVFAAMQLPISI
jgi:hypothetical protein